MRVPGILSVQDSQPQFPQEVYLCSGHTQSQA